MSSKLYLLRTGLHKSIIRMCKSNVTPIGHVVLAETMWTQEKEDAMRYNLFLAATYLEDTHKVLCPKCDDDICSSETDDCVADTWIFNSPDISNIRSLCTIIDDIQN